MGVQITESLVRNPCCFHSSALVAGLKPTEGVEEGDYLSWQDIGWKLHGQASMETVGANEPCTREPFLDLYYTQFPGMQACMHHCENLGTRVPPVSNFQDWAKVQDFLKMKLFDKELNTCSR